MPAEPIAEYVISPHAAFEMARRRISEETVQGVMTAPEQRLPVGVPLMKVNYDLHTDILTVILKYNVAVAESDEDKPGVILDYDAPGELISLEIHDASRRVSEARKVEFQMAE